MRHRSALSRSPSRHHRSSATGGSGRTPRRSLRSPQQLVQLPLLLTALLALLVADLADALLDRLDAFLEDAHLGVRLGRLLLRLGVRRFQRHHARVEHARARREQQEDQRPGHAQHPARRDVLAPVRARPIHPVIAHALDPSVLGHLLCQAHGARADLRVIDGGEHLVRGLLPPPPPPPAPRDLSRGGRPPPPAGGKGLGRGPAVGRGADSLSPREQALEVGFHVGHVTLEDEERRRVRDGLVAQVVADADGGHASRVLVHLQAHPALIPGDLRTALIGHAHYRSLRPRRAERWAFRPKRPARAMSSDAATARRCEYPGFRLRGPPLPRPSHPERAGSGPPRGTGPAGAMFSDAATARRCEYPGFRLRWRISAPTLAAGIVYSFDVTAPVIVVA